MQIDTNRSLTMPDLLWPTSEQYKDKSFEKSHTLKVSLRCVSFATSLIVKLAIIANTNCQSTCKLY